MLKTQLEKVEVGNFTKVGLNYINPNEFGGVKIKEKNTDVGVRAEGIEN